MNCGPREEKSLVGVTTDPKTSSGVEEGSWRWPKREGKGIFILYTEEDGREGVQL